MVGKGRRTASARPRAARSFMTAQYAPARGKSGRRAIRAPRDPPHSQRAGLHPLRRAARAVGREGDLPTQTQVADEPQQTRLTPPLGGPAHHPVPPALAQLGEVAAVAMTADEESQALVTPVVQEGED